MAEKDRERSKFAQRAGRYARVGAGVAGVAARAGASRLFGGEGDRSREAREIRAFLGSLKGPMMKAAQILATVPDLVPPEYAEELRQLQSSAPPMGPGFVRRRMAAELGADWRSQFADFDGEAAFAASLGQVHRARHKDGRALACKLQYPDMQSAVEADINQLNMAVRVFRQIEDGLDPTDLAQELAIRLREELDYIREAAHVRLYAAMLEKYRDIRVPDVVEELSTARLLTMTWLEGERILDFKQAPLETRNTIARCLFRAWWGPLARYGVIHGDPHLGNYTFAPEDATLNLLDFGCIRIFEPKFIAGVVDLFKGLRDGDDALVVHAYETWGFTGLSRAAIDTLNIWARFIYGPLIDDRVRTTADGVAPSEYGRKEAFAVRRGLKEHGPIKPPREFVFMDRAAIGLGSVFIHLNAELNWRRIFEDEIENFDLADVTQRQKAALDEARVPAAS